MNFMILVSGKLLWDSLFPQFDTKQATGSERWQISATKWLKKDLQKLMKIRRTELLIQQYLKTHKNNAVWVECFQWRGGSETAGEAARLMAPPPVILLLPFDLGRVSCRRHNMQ